MDDISKDLFMNVLNVLEEVINNDDFNSFIKKEFNNSCELFDNDEENKLI
jgi:hypothetical protein